MDITRAVSVPSRVVLGGREWLASEFRVREYAALQQFIRVRESSPYDVALPFLDGPMDNPARVLLLARTIRAQDDWPPSPSSPGGAAILEAPEGARYFAWLALRRDQPHLSLEDVAGVLEAARPHEWGNLRRVAWGTDPMAILMALVDGPPEGDGADDDDAPPPRPISWPEVKWAYHEKYPGGPPFADLTMTDLSVVLNGGKYPEPGAINKQPEELTPGDLARLFRREEFWELVGRIEGGG